MNPGGRFAPQARQQGVRFLTFEVIYPCPQALLPFTVLRQKMCSFLDTLTNAHDLAKIGHPGTPKLTKNNLVLGI